MKHESYKNWKEKIQNTHTDHKKPRKNTRMHTTHLKQNRGDLSTQFQLRLPTAPRDIALSLILPKQEGCIHSLDAQVKFLPSLRHLHTLNLPYHDVIYPRGTYAY